MNMLSQEQLDRMFETQVRIGKIIHVQGSLVDLDDPSDEIQAFIEDEFCDPATLARFEPLWPGVQKRVVDALAHHKRAVQCSSRRDADQMLLEHLARILHDAPFALLVMMESAFAECVVADVEGECLGTWRSGYGVTDCLWFGVNDVAEAVEKMLAKKREWKLASWNQAISEGRVSRKDPSA